MSYTPDLFGQPDLSRTAARTRALADARARGELGMHRAAAKADRVNSEWCTLALEALRKFAAGTPGFFTIEQARSVIEADPSFPKPTDGRAWGFPVVSAIKAGYVVKTRHTAPAASSNGSPKPLFTRGPAAMEAGT